MSDIRYLYLRHVSYEISSSRLLVLTLCVHIDLVGTMSFIGAAENEL